MNGQGFVSPTKYNSREEYEMRMIGCKGPEPDPCVKAPRKATVGNSLERLMTAVCSLEGTMDRAENIIFRPRVEKDNCTNGAVEQPTIPGAIEEAACRVGAVQERLDRLGMVVADHFEGGWKLE